jgi:hypothetical protein
MNTSKRPWSRPVALDDVPEGGLHLDMFADEATRAALAELAGGTSCPRLEATFDVTRWGRGGLRVTGEVRGTIGQNCVVSLEPISNDVREPVEVIYASPEAPAFDSTDELVVVPGAADPPEPLVDGTIDLGQIATEFFVLGVDPYPRKADVVFAAPAVPTGSETAGDSPFAALAALKKDRNKGE